MKKFKQLVSIGLVLLVSLSVCSTVFAAKKITINSATLQEFKDETGTVDDSTVNIKVSFTTSDELSGQISVHLASKNFDSLPSGTTNQAKEAMTVYADQIEIPADSTYTFPVLKSRIKSATGLTDIEGCTLYLRMGAMDSDPDIYVITYHDPSTQVDPPTPVINYGDVNKDGKITNKDTAFLARYLAKWSGYDETNVDTAAADVNADGKTTNKDTAILARHLAKWSGYEVLPYK